MALGWSRYEAPAGGFGAPDEQLLFGGHRGRSYFTERFDLLVVRDQVGVGEGSMRLLVERGRIHLGEVTVPPTTAHWRMAPSPGNFRYQNPRS